MSKNDIALKNITTIISEQNLIKDYPEFVNFKDHVLSLDTFGLTSTIEKINYTIDTINTIDNYTTINHTLVNDDSKYYYIQDLILHVKLNKFSEELNNKILSMIKNISLLLDDKMLEKIYSDTLHSTNKKYNKCTYLTHKNDGSISIFVNLPFSICSNNNMLLKSFIKNKNVSIKLKILSDFLLSSSLELHYTKIIIDLEKNSNYPKCNLSKYIPDIVFGELYEKISYEKKQIDMLIPTTYNIVKNKNTAGFNFYFVTKDNELIKNHIFSNVILKIGDQQNNLSLLTFLNGSILNVDSNTVYNVPTFLYKNIKSEHNMIKISFKFELLKEYESDQIYLCVCQTTNELMAYVEKDGVYDVIHI